MKSAVIFIFLIFSAACSTQNVESQKRTENPAAENQTKQAVLIELFTSEG